MAVLKTVFAVTAKSGNLRTNVPVGRRRLLAFAPVGITWQRDAHSQDITKNMQYISTEKTKLTADPQTMRLDRATDRPLCVLLNWLLARQKHIMKYASIYMEQGFDVLSVSCTPWQLLWPMKGSQLVAADLLRFLKSNESHAPVTLHGFSVGGYLWGELLMHAATNKPLYQPVLDRVRAQVWDSAVDISELTEGVPNAVFPKNKVMHATLKKYLQYHMRTFHEQATVHYMRSSQMFHLNMCRAPALFLVSSLDQVGSVEANSRVAESWNTLGTKVTFKSWDNSHHVQHLSRNRQEYLEVLFAHLDAAGLVCHPEKMQLRA